MAWFGRGKRSIRIYVYISDAKLEMLWQQIPQRILKRISAELKIDLKVAGLTLRSGDAPEATRIEKLHVVERYIDKHLQVGTVDEPGRQFFRGRMEMRWGRLPAGTPGRPPIAFFQGQDVRAGLARRIVHQSEQAPQLIDVIREVTLAGSWRHVVGDGPPDSDVELGGHSLLPNIFLAIKDHISELPDLGEVWCEGSSEPLVPERVLNACDVVSIPTPTQELEFLAIPLVQQRVFRRHAVKSGLVSHGRVLATPVYVAVDLAPKLVARPKRMVDQFFNNPGSHAEYEIVDDGRAG